MNRKIFSIIGFIILGILLFGAGVWFGQAQIVNASWQPGWMMGNTNTTAQPGYGMMGGPGMMNNGMMSGQYGNMMNGAGMMNGQYNNMMGTGQVGTGMMGMMTGLSGLSDVEPLTIEEAKTAVTNYLSTLNQDNLALGEIMIFSNHAYAQILNTDTEQGAFEVLVDPTTGNVFPEPGPNMMWNTEYGMMGGMGSSMMNGQYNRGMMNGQSGNMMGNWTTTDDAEIGVTATEASAVAQAYLDEFLPGTTAEDHADIFPGYYTLHIERDGAVIGMLSVNAYTGDGFLHHWHGDFIEINDAP